jgi:hypothetical protein
MNILPLAYVDPVSGMIVIQLLIGGCIGVVACFRKLIWGSLGWFIRSRVVLSADDSADDSDAPVVLKIHDPGEWAPSVATCEDQQSRRKVA